MMMKSRRSEAGQRFEERRLREEEAPRLRERVPSLATLRLDIAEGRGVTNADPKHTRIIVVDRAPALFSLLCADHACRDGGHDLTSDVMRGLLAGATRFELDDPCRGSVGVAECGRTMHVQVTATYG
ncbi:MAG: hypothetical protein ACRELB_16890 [Polyangiaceae bacterium]